MRVIACLSDKRSSFIWHLAICKRPKETKGCGLLPVQSQKASDWLLLVPNYLLEPRKRWRRRLRVAPGGPTLVWWPPLPPLPPHTVAVPNAVSRHWAAQ